MALPRHHSTVPGPGAPRAGFDDDGDLGAYLEPVISGARARGVADGLEMIGVGAVLIDGTGKVLHVGGRGRRMLGGYARIAGDHLLAERPSDNAAIQTLIGSAIGIDRHDPQARVRLGAPTGTGLSIRAIRFDDDQGATQLLRAVVILEQDDPA